MKKVLVLIAAVVALAGCVSIPPNPLTPDARQALFVKDVAATWALTPPKKEPKKPVDPVEFKAAQTDVETRLTAAVGNAFASSPAGADGVTFKIEIKRFTPGFLGSVGGDVTVIRVADNKVLGVYTDVFGADTSGAQGGLIGLAIAAASKPDSIGIMSNQFATNLRARFERKK